MLLVRYNHIRERLIKLYTMIQYRPFNVWIAPKTMMDLEELRDRPSLSFQNSEPDPDYYENQQLRSMTVAHLTKYLGNYTSPDDVAYQDPNTIIPLLYEGCQEYLLMWCEIIKEVPDVPFPNIIELRIIEDFAITLFPAYRKIKPFLNYQERQAMAAVNKDMYRRGLAGLMGLFQTERIGVKGEGDKMSFVSYLDALHESMNWSNPHGVNLNALKSSGDSLLDINKTTNDAGLGAWFMQR